MVIGVQEVLILSRALETERLFLFFLPPLSRSRIHTDLLDRTRKQVLFVKSNSICSSTNVLFYLPLYNYSLNWKKSYNVIKCKLKQVSTVNNRLEEKL